MLYLTYSQVPELKSLPREQWRAVLLSAGRAFGKTPLFWRVWWLTIFLTFGIGICLALAISFAGGAETTAFWAFTISGLIGYTIAFSVRTNCLRPYIRQHLSSGGGA